MWIAQMQEGRRYDTPGRGGAAAGVGEMAGPLYDTRYNLERAKLNLLKHTGAAAGCTEVENGKEIGADKTPMNADSKTSELAGHLNCYDFSHLCL